MPSNSYFVWNETLGYAFSGKVTRNENLIIVISNIIPANGFLSYTIRSTPGGDIIDSGSSITYYNNVLTLEIPLLEPFYGVGLI